MDQGWSERMAFHTIGSDEQIFLGFPCHHLAWPRACDQCGNMANGLNIFQDAGEREGRGYDYAYDATFCFTCHRIAVQTTAWEGFNRVRILAAIWNTFGFHKTSVVFLDPADYAEKCIREG